MKIQQEEIDRVKAENTIKDVCYRYNISLNKNDMAICPFHSDKYPSLKVYPKTNTFYCFGCGVGGDAIKMVMTMENVDFISAIKILGGNTSNTGNETTHTTAFNEAKERKLSVYKKKEQIEEQLAEKSNQYLKLLEIIKSSKPLSNEWVRAKNELQMVEESIKELEEFYQKLDELY